MQPWPLQSSKAALAEPFTGLCPGPCVGCGWLPRVEGGCYLVLG
jgi:hypothetical protein